METKRNGLTGVTNIIRFNYGYYLFGIGFIIVLFSFAAMTIGLLQTGLYIAGLAVSFALVVSLLVSWYVYDLSRLYDLDFLNKKIIEGNGTQLNIHAGFDETSGLLQQKYPNNRLIIFDFYNPEKHTEISIKRARQSYPPYPGTVAVTTSSLPLENQSIDNAFLFFAAHEIRDDNERKTFFKELYRVVHPEGHIHIIEHLRDFPNFLAYTIGAFHFLSVNTWQNTFEKSGWKTKREQQLNPFVKYYILTK
jgi:SAM-dependent methyltransferase